MNSTNFGLIIFITILVVHQSRSQYGNIDEEIESIKIFNKKLLEFVDKYTKDVEQFRKAQDEVGKGAEFREFEHNLKVLYSKTVQTNRAIIKDLGKLKDAPKDIAGDIVKLHFEFVETQQNWDIKFKKLWGDYSAILHQGSDENETILDPPEPMGPQPKPLPKKEL